MIDRYHRKIRKTQSKRGHPTLQYIPTHSNKCVISLGINNPQSPSGHPRIISQNFIKGIQRIKEGLIRTNFSGQFLHWCDDYPIGSPKHWEVPFAFKPYCFQEALNQNFQLILWLDSSIKIKQPIEPLFELIKKDGYLIFQEDHSVGEYCSDAALKTLSILREESFKIQSCWSCVLGLNLQTIIAREFLKIWKEKASDGVTFPGAKWGKVSEDKRVKGHRYDQTAASVIALQLNMNHWKNKTFFENFFENDRSYVRCLDE